MRGKEDVQGVSLFWLSQRPDDAYVFHEDLEPTDSKPVAYSQLGVCALLKKWGPKAKPLMDDLNHAVRNGDPSARRELRDTWHIVNDSK
jgi:hypothetical protein